MQSEFDKQLSRYRGASPFPLEYLIPVDYANERDFWHCLISDIESIGSGWESIDRVHSDSAELIPDRKGIYIFIWSPDVEIKSEARRFVFNNVVYIGSSVTPELGMKSRFVKEYSKIIGRHLDIHWTKKELSNRSDRLKKVLNLGQITLFFNVMDNATSEQILNLEERLIKYFNPPGNKVGTIIKAKLSKKEVLPAFKGY